MKSKIALAAAATLLSAGVAYAERHASGDAAAGEAVFRQCAACHNVVNDAGDVLAGRPNMRTGPNLYGVAGETFGDIERFPLLAGPAGPERSGRR
jgi:cytochrome c